MTIGSALKIGLGVVCFAIGAACLIGAICILLFISASDAAIPTMFGAFGAIFYRLLFCCYAGCAGTAASSNGRCAAGSALLPTADTIAQTSGTLGATTYSAVLADACHRIRLLLYSTGRIQPGTPPCCLASFAFSFSPPPLSSFWPCQRAPRTKRSNTPAKPSPAPS